MALPAKLPEEEPKRPDLKLVGDNQPTGAEQADKGVLDNVVDLDAERKKRRPEHTPKFTGSDESTVQQDKAKGRGFWHRQKRKIITVGILGGVVGYGGFLFMTGPFQVIQFAQLLQQFHFSNNENTQDSRMIKLVRWMRYPDKPELRRLGRVKNVFADGVTDSLYRKGFDLRYSDALRGGFLERVYIDPNRPIDIDGLKAEGLNVQFDDGLGQNFIDVSDGKYFKTRKTLRALVGLTDYGKISSSLHSRLLIKRAGITFHPLGNIKRKARESIVDWVGRLREDRTKTLKEGAKAPTTASQPAGEDASEEDQAKARNAEQASVDANEVTNTSGETTPKGRIAKVRSNIGFKAGAGASALVGVMCLLKGLGESGDQLEHDNTVMPLMRVGFRVIAAGNQVMSGQDLNISELSEEISSFYDEANKTSWFNAASVQAELDRPYKKDYDVPESAKPDGTKNILSQITDRVPALDEICGFAGNTFGRVVFGAIDLVTGPGSFFISEIINATGALNPLLDGIVRILAGEEVNVDAAGKDFGGFANYGARYAANEQALQYGGREMSPPEVAELDAVAEQNRQDYVNLQGLGYKLFGLSNPHSLAAKVATAAPRQPQSFSGLLDFVGTVKGVFSKAASVLLPKSQALTPGYDYGFPEFGFSQAELNDDRFENPYENEVQLFTGHPDYDARLDDLNERYGKPCFGITLNSSGSFTQSDPKAYEEIPGDCKKTADENIELVRYRFFMLDSMTATALACQENDETACQQFGLSKPTSSSSSPTITGLECPPEPLEALQVGGSTYYRMPEAPNGEYVFEAPPNQRYGSKELICTLWTVSKAYAAKWQGQSQIKINDLNASGHQSHKNGVDVDINAIGNVACCDLGRGGYSKEATVDLGKLFADTGIIKVIFWDATDGSSEEVNNYANQIGKPWVEPMHAIGGHSDHFHVRIIDDFRLETYAP